MSEKVDIQRVYRLTLALITLFILLGMLFLFITAVSLMFKVVFGL